MQCRSAMIGLAALALAACAHQPTPLQGEYATMTPRDAATTDATGQVVRWGGRIVQTEPHDNRTCFEVAATQLTASARPWWGNEVDDGRFIACRAGFYDPTVFEPNREVTFTGRIEGYDTRSLDGHDYRFPRIAADAVYLWPANEPRVLTYPPPWPWWGYW